MTEENPYREQAKHVIGATSLFLLVIAVALGLDRLTYGLIALAWIEKNGLYHWVFRFAEIIILLVDVAALLTIVVMTTYKFLRKLVI